MSKIRKKYDKAPYQVLIIKYTCGTCCRRWQSANGSLSDYQIYKNCYEKCYPGSYKYQAPNKKGNQNPETFIAHNTELCGKCIRLGYSCMEDIGNERSGTVVSNLEGEEITLETADFSQYFTLAEKQMNEKHTYVKPLSKKMQQRKERQKWCKFMVEGKKKNAEEKLNDKSKNTAPKVTEEEKAITSMINSLNISTAVGQSFNNGNSSNNNVQESTEIITGSDTSAKVNISTDVTRNIDKDIDDKTVLDVSGVNKSMEDKNINEAITNVDIIGTSEKTINIIEKTGCRYK